MSIDIFIKTYHKDFVWLEYCLKSIRKNARGFRNVVVVTDDGHKLDEKLLNILPIQVFYVPLPEKTPTFVEHGLGYLWQQYIKLTWYNYSDADEVLILDSDEMLSQPTTPDNFKTNGKYNWFFREWKYSGNGICWKKSTEFIFKEEALYDAMCLTGFIFQKETSIAFRNHILKLHEIDDLWSLFIKYNLQTASEFNLFGTFIYLYGRVEYQTIILGEDDLKKYFNSTIHKEWSWGGLTEEIKAEKEKLLNE
jgi:hypothetical protein